MKEFNEDPKNFTKYEKARMVGSRALQLSMGAPINIKLSEEELTKVNYNPIQIAKLEFAEGKIPMTVIRRLPSEKTKAFLEETAKEEAKEKEAASEENSVEEEI